MRFLIVLFLLLSACTQTAPVRRVCAPARCAPDEAFDTRLCSCELRDDAVSE